MAGLYQGPIIDPHIHLWDLGMDRHPWLRPTGGEIQALGDLDASSSAIAIEHIKIENEGWELDASVTEPLET